MSCKCCQTVGSPPPWQMLLERKNKCQAERKRQDEEMEELRRSNQQELENLRVQLCKARTSTDNSASEQVPSNKEAGWKMIFCSNIIDRWML